MTLTREQAMAEYRATGRKQRLAGLSLIVLGAMMAWLAPQAGAASAPVQWASYAALAAGWALMLAAIFMRTRYRRRLLRELP